MNSNFSAMPLVTWQSIGGICSSYFDDKLCENDIEASFWEMDEGETHWCCICVGIFLLIET